MTAQWRWRGRTSGAGSDLVKKARRGQAITEMALLTPFFMLLLLGALDLGRIFIVQNRLNSAVKEAAMLALYQPDPPTVQARAFQEVTDPATGRKLLGKEGEEFWVTIKCFTAAGVQKTDPPGDPCSDPGPGDYIEVTGHHIFRPITSQILRFLPADGTIRKTVRAVY